jgi:hypothetical protein
MGMEPESLPERSQSTSDSALVKAQLMKWGLWDKIAWVKPMRDVFLQAVLVSEEYGNQGEDVWDGFTVVFRMDVNSESEYAAFRIPKVNHEMDEKHIALVIRKMSEANNSKVHMVGPVTIKWNRN